MQPIRFGPYALDARNGELRRDGEVVPLAPQPFRLLLALASRPGELVTREELHREVWGDETFVDFERGLNFCILQARTALGDDAKNPQYIETLPRRGYRFVANVGRASARPVRWLVAAAALLVVLAAIAWQRDEPVVTGRLMLAVLPFEGAAPFADGMTEELITHLGALQPQRLGVIARTSVFLYRDTKKSVRDIGRELGVRYVVDGSVRREGERVRVSAQLIDTRDQTQLWSESFDRTGAGALAIQRDVAERIARALRIELLNDDTLSARSPAAHEAYLRGRQQSSVEELRTATQLEPGFVLAHVALAEALHIEAMRELVDARVAGEEIRAASETAMRLAPSLSQAHDIAAMHAFWYEWNWDAAEDAYQRAIRFNPNEPGALHDHGWLLITQGKFDEGIAEIRRAQELDPVSPRANVHVAWAYIYTRRYDDAIREARRALALDPKFEEALGCIHSAEMLAGKHRPRPATESRDPYSTAVSYALNGDRENALVWLTKARDSRNLSFPLAGVDPKLDALNGDPRFVELLASARLTRQIR
ncbi:MAG TPA: winged helix-turn-helix domain-containing protein [Thermoanaerobaculia bacterium]|jgi:TolB-like protein/DNA-binding winged helix-turn-helix (wHTH) protein/tetratricopeptide (TPR) repeat protein|nr:winged helix-turn-helix domain-containing protein [Thermoanaerobaculia bacterium]